MKNLHQKIVLNIFLLCLAFGTLWGQSTVESLTLPDGRLIEVREGNTWFEVPLIMEHELTDGRIIEIFSNNEWREQTVDTVKIAFKVWKNKNHDSPIFRDGTLIKKAENEEEWSDAIQNDEPAWCYYEFSENNAYMGKVYNWYAVNGNKEIAPEGWTIPDSSDWQSLINHVNALGSNPYLKLMKEDGWPYWSETTGRNNTGFSAMANGFLHARFHPSLKNQKTPSYWSIPHWSCCHSANFWLKKPSERKASYFHITPLNWGTGEQLGFGTDTHGGGTFIRLIRE